MMKVMITKKIETDIKFMKVDAQIRYWVDSLLNGVEAAEDGNNFPCKNENQWCPLIDVDKGIITNWELGTSANIHFKVCDACAYSLINTIGEIEYKHDYNYVPDILCPESEGYGDYIIMNIDINGKINKWNKSLVSELFVKDGDK